MGASYLSLIICLLLSLVLVSILYVPPTQAFTFPTESNFEAPTYFRDDDDGQGIHRANSRIILIILREQCYRLLRQRFRDKLKFYCDLFTNFYV